LFKKFNDEIMENPKVITVILKVPKRTLTPCETCYLKHEFENIGFSFKVEGFPDSWIYVKPV